MQRLRTIIAVVAVVSTVGAAAVAVTLPHRRSNSRPSGSGAESAAASTANDAGRGAPRSGNSSTPGTAVSAVVPWVDRPATSPPPFGPDSAPATPSPASPPCSAAQVKATSGGSGGAAGNDISVVALENVGSRDCSLSGYPTSLALVDAAGVRHSMTPSHGTMFDSQYSWPVDLHPGDTGRVGVTFSGGCAAAQQPSRSPTQYISVVLGLPGGGTVSAPADVVGTCGIGVTQLGQPQPTPPAGPYDGLTADMHAPDTVVGGSTLDYTVTLTNGSDHTIAFDPCPTYQQALYFVTAPPVPRPQPEFFELNCDTVRDIAPGQSIRYAMRIQIPQVPATTSATKFVWLMADGMGVGTGRALTVTNGAASSPPPSAPASSRIR